MARCLVGALRLLTGDAPARTREEATPGPCLPCDQNEADPRRRFPSRSPLPFSLAALKLSPQLCQPQSYSIDKWKYTRIQHRRVAVGLLKNPRPVRRDCHLLSHQDYKLILLQSPSRTSQTGYHHKPLRIPWQMSVAVHVKFMLEPK
jgi:hypothetical protein